MKGGQWATENPLSTKGYAKKYGLPVENTGSPDWVAKAKIYGEPNIVKAPPGHNNPLNIGGAPEIRPNRTRLDVELEWFHMP